MDTWLYAAKRLHRFVHHDAFKDYIRGCSNLWQIAPFYFIQAAVETDNLEAKKFIFDVLAKAIKTISRRCCFSLQRPRK